MSQAVLTSGSRAGEAGGSLILGRYRPLRPLGTGGSGSVWLARDEEGGRDVALKVVRREGKAAARAEREVEAAARLRHPSCLRALALDRDDEHVYVAYEYVRGRTLRDAMRGGDLDDAAAVEAAAQVLEGLAHAHGKGVVHRDVKPANVMLEEGDEVSVRVLDFGLARVEEADSLTAAGDIPGTLAYIAPERLDGETGSGAADVWSVGVMLWEALAGWHPFASASPVETARRIREGARPLAVTRPDLPAELCAIVDRMLVRDPRRRPAARRLADALRDAFATRVRRPRPATSLRALRERALHAGLAALLAGGSTALLPFFPRGWPLLLGAVAGLVALRAPRAGVAVALAAPVLPLGNISLGLALAYAVAALAWLVAFSGDPRRALVFVAGPVFAPVGLLGLVPPLALAAGAALRRALVGGVSVLAAAIVATLAGLPFPLPAPATPLELDATARPDEAAAAIAGVLGSRPDVVALALVFAVAAAGAPYARARGLWGAAGWGAVFLAAAILLPHLAGAESVSALLMAPGVCTATGLLGARAARSALRG